MAGRDGPTVVGQEGPVVCRTRSVDLSPWAAIRSFAGPRIAWASPGGPTLVGCGVATAVTGGGADRFDDVRSAATSVFDGLEFAPAPGVEEPVPAVARPRLVGGFAFHDEGDPGPPWTGFRSARFVLPRIQVVSAGGDTWVTATTAGPEADREATEAALDSAIRRIDETATSRSPPPGIGTITRDPDRASWREQVRSILARVDDGSVEKVVLAGTLTARLREPLRLADTLARMEESSRDCFRFAVDPGFGTTFFGATPERLVTLRDGRVFTEALAGSIGRGGTEAEDEHMARRLLGTPRIRHEHRLVAETIRDRLAKFSDAVDVGDVGVRRLENVQHLETRIEAALRAPAHVVDVVSALHPTPAVGGLPPEAARRLIRETESFDRGWYAGPVGWFDAEGTGTFAVGIRSAVATGEAVTLYAGNGIVRDSDPEEEWDELQLKYRSVLDQLQP